MPDRSQDIIRAHESFVKLHMEEPGFLVKFHPDDPRNVVDLGAHGVRTTRSEEAAPFYHAVNFDGNFGGKLLFHLFTIQCRAGL